MCVCKILNRFVLVKYGKINRFVLKFRPCGFVDYKCQPGYQ